MNDPALRPPASPRLTWHHLVRERRADLLAVARDEDVRRYLLDGQHVPDEWADSELEHSDALMAHDRVGIWLLEQAGDIIGLAGFRRFPQHGPEPEVVVALRPQAWRRGLGTEALSALVALATARGWGRVCASTDAPNTASAAWLLRGGFRPAGRTPGPFGETLHFVCDGHAPATGWGGVARFDIDRDWTGTPARRDERASVEVDARGADVTITIDAPYFADPPPPPPAGPRDGLWDYEVVEVMLLGDGEQYLELEFGPHGHYLALMLCGRRRAVARAMPCLVDTTIDGRRWRTRAIVPSRWLPPGLHAGNAFAIHGLASQRRYLAAHPVPGDAPDFHRLEHFAPLPVEPGGLRQTDS